MNFLTLLSIFSSLCTALQISVESKGGNSSIFQYSLMLEDLNYGGEGGLYAELIQNRAFQGSSFYPRSLVAWSPINGAVLSLKNLTQPLSSALPTSMNVAAKSGSGTVGFANSGYWGIDVQVKKYTRSFYVKGSYSGSFTVSLQSNLTSEFILTPSKAASNVNNTFAVTFESSAVRGSSLDFNLISLFPPTWNNRPNGLSPDLVQALSDLKTKFFRFPGGSDLEGLVRGEEWKWNETIGPLKTRPGRPNCWGYQEAGGFGLVEMLLLTDDLGLGPILAVEDGHWLNNEVANKTDLQPHIDDMLNELEFITGPINTPYRALRASLGCPKPWKIKYVEIGNEDNIYGGLGSYISYRFQAFYDAITAKYPDITDMASTVELVLPKEAAGDYHQYANPDALVRQFNYLDQNGTEHLELNGEIAAKFANGLTWGDNAQIFPWWIGSVSEAVFYLGLERNGNKIIGSAYAPLFQNMNSWAWSPDLIQFSADPADTVRSTSWHVIEFYASHMLTHILPTTDSYGPLYYVAGRNQDRGSPIFKAAVYNSTGNYPVSVSFDGVSEGTSAALTYLLADDPYAYNAAGHPEVIKSVASKIVASEGGNFTLPNLSVAVLETD